MILQVKVIADIAAKDKIIDIEYNDDTGLFNGSNADNWNNLIELTGSQGNWTKSFKQMSYADIWVIL